jgi:hypothetical protein
MGMLWGPEARFATHGRVWYLVAAAGARVALAVVSIVVVAMYLSFVANSKQNSGGAVGLGVVATGSAVFLLPNVLVWWTLWKYEWVPFGIAWRRCHRICGACRYPLTNTPDPDGCTVCPECGAAWKLPPPPPNNPV